MQLNGIDLSADRLKDFCRKWMIVEFGLFGSVLRQDFRQDSDIDVLVSFADDAHWGLFDLCRMEEELAAILGRKVDLITRRSVEESRNPIRRAHILNNLEIINVAG